ncbi:conserved protein of unknown function [Petrocella atlantisensis]|uniref:GH18 domain-containing protein n=1 Tax=Petrocella atlantisensis TaxID=2173034 RepID=A0A3P7P2X7_9FIRM|nr:glycosyl hydrolase family 18 protein [Petrocella atlantisensis]VDN47860.1 conserved protein of unknown function [Petrocella atlantisensis]
MLKLLRVIALIIVFLLVGFGTNFFIMKNVDETYLIAPNMTMEPVENLMTGLSEDETLVIMENKMIELDHYPRYVDDVVYVPITFVMDYFNDGFYWDNEEKILTYTTLKDVIRMETDALTYFVNKDPISLEIPIRELVADIPYMPLELVKKFAHHDFYYDGTIDTLTIEDKSLDGTYGIVSPSTLEYGVIRSWKDQKSTVVKKAARGEEVKIYDDDGIWQQVRTKEGLIGYIRKDEMGQERHIAGEPVVREIYNYDTRPTFDGALNLAWHQVTNTTANRYLEDVLEGVHGLNVISPTWLHIKDSEGNITNIADLDYVNKAHARGIQVWALFSNQFDRKLTHEVLSSTTKREKLIRELLALSALYNLDGINVDFENVGQEDGIYFIQFIKELTPYLKNQGLVVSVDMYVPSQWTAHYGRKEIGEIVDYVMIMAYDEHWSTSPDSGSVASIGFVEKGIVDTLKEVPKEKTVLGLPYYTRRWTEEVVDGEIKVSSRAYGMDTAYKIMTDEGVTFRWLDDIKQYYGEYEKDGKTYKMWLEEEQSIEEKVKLLSKHQLVGVAGWKIGLEKEAIWDVLRKYLVP